MADFISDLAAKAGIDTSLAQKGLGAILTTLQKHVPSDVYSKVSGAIPNAGNLLSAFQSAPAAPKSAGLGDLANLVGGLLGGKSEAASTLLSQFAKAGFSIDTAKTFLPVLFSVLKERLPPETMKQVENTIPGLSNLLGGTDTTGLFGKVKKLFG